MPCLLGDSDMNDETYLAMTAELNLAQNFVNYFFQHCKTSITETVYCTQAATSEGFAFIYFDDERDAEDAIHYLDNSSFGFSRRRLTVEWARDDRGPRLHDGSKPSANTRPTKTLFVINFDPIYTRARDIERHFEPYGRIVNVRVRRNFAFIRFATQEEATKALECTNMSKLLDRVVSVEYAFRDDGEQDRRGSSKGGYERVYSPYDRSLSPAPRNRPSPDYGRGRSSAYDRYDESIYDRHHSPERRYYRSRSPARRSRS